MERDSLYLHIALTFTLRHNIYLTKTEQSMNAKQVKVEFKSATATTVFTSSHLKTIMRKKYS